MIVTEKYIFSFQHYCVRYTMIKKIYLSPIVNCYYPTASWLCQKNIFPITTTFTTPWSWQKYVFISALCVLHLDHDKKHALLIQFYTLWIRIMKKKFFPIATMLTTFVIMTKKFFFVAATFTMPWLALCRLCSGYKKKCFRFYFSPTSLRLGHDWRQINFHSNNTFPTQ